MPRFNMIDVFRPSLVGKGFADYLIMLEFDAVKIRLMLNIDGVRTPIKWEHMSDLRKKLREAMHIGNVTIYQMLD